MFQCLVSKQQNGNNGDRYTEHSKQEDFERNTLEEMKKIYKIKYVAVQFLRIYYVACVFLYFFCIASEELFIQNTAKVYKLIF